MSPLRQHISEPRSDQEDQECEDKIKIPIEWDEFEYKGSETAECEVEEKSDHTPIKDDAPCSRYESLPRSLGEHTDEISTTDHASHREYLSEDHDDPEHEDDECDRSYIADVEGEWVRSEIEDDQARILDISRPEESVLRIGSDPSYEEDEAHEDICSYHTHLEEREGDIPYREEGNESDEETIGDLTLHDIGPDDCQIDDDKSRDWRKLEIEHGI
jgi:hypothetical protein